MRVTESTRSFNSQIMTNALITCQDAANRVSILQVHICVTAIKDSNLRMMASAVPVSPVMEQITYSTCKIVIIKVGDSWK